jgi:hypothetical protein
MGVWGYGGIGYGGMRVWGMGENRNYNSTIFSNLS